MADTAQIVRDYIVENFLMGDSSNRFAESDSLMERHILDSTGFLELVCFLETRFEMRIEDTEMVPENLDSLTAIAAFVKRKLASPDTSVSGVYGCVARQA